MKPHLQHVPYSVGYVYLERFVEFGSIHIENVDNLLQTSDLRQVLEDQNIRALIAAPFWQNGEMFGFVGLDYTDGPRRFSSEEDNLMRGFAAQTGMLRALERTSRESLRLEADLARARTQLGATVAALPELLVETDSDGIIVGFQQSTPLTFAASPQEVIGQSPEAVLPDHLARICRKAMREVDLFGWSQSHNYSVDTPAGSEMVYALRDPPHPRCQNYRRHITWLSVCCPRRDPCTTTGPAYPPTCARCGIVDQSYHAHR